MEYFVRNCVLHRSMQNKHSYPEHWLRSHKKWWPCEHTRFFKYPRWISGTVPLPEYKDELGYKLGTGKKIVTWHFFTHGAFRSSQEVVETYPCVPDRNGIWKCLFLRRGNTEIHGEKPLGARTRTNNKLNPHTCMASTSGFEPDHIGGRRVLQCSYHCATPHFC